MSVREQLEQEQKCASKLYEDVKQVIEVSNCTFEDAISTLYRLANYYKKACACQKIRQ